MAADPTPYTGDSGSVVEEARRRYRIVSEYEGDARDRFLEDYKFANGDSHNNYQWPNAVRRQRDVDNRPCLTINVVRQHNNQISNAARRAKSEPRIMAMGNGATQESANMLKQIIRHIEYQSDAQTAYTVAREFQVDAGWGWWRLTTDYAAEDTFDQEIYVRAVMDPLSIFMDPDVQRLDCSDSRYALIFDTMVPKDQFEAMYPGQVDLTNIAPLGVNNVGDNWIEQEHVMLCEYFRKVSYPDTVVNFLFEGQRYSVLRSKLPPSVAEDILSNDLTRTRKTFRDEIEWYLIAGEQIIDSTIWPGKYIPLIRVLGRQTVIEGRLDRPGHTRSMISAQHMFNYNASSQVEFGGTQGKTPWVAPAKAIEEFETYWNTANTQNHSVLPWNHVDDQNPEVQIPPPIRVEPPNFAPLYEKGMETAFNQMMMASGQWQNQMGMMGNERTGKAIAERQEQSDTSTYHFQDNYEMALVYSTKQLIDLIPRIYDTRRVLMIQADDGLDYELTIDPQAAQAYAAQRAFDGRVIQRVFNPKLGAYQVAATVGPATGSKRQQTADALTLILTQNPGLTGLIGDLLMKSYDFDLAQEAAERLRRMVPPQALGEGPSPEVAQLQQVVQLLQQNLAKTIDQGGKDRLKLVGKDQMRDIDAYKAETDRMKALVDMLPMDASGLQQIIEQLVQQSLDTKLSPILEANRQGVGEQSESGQPSAAAEQPPIEGAQKAPDGEWYLSDPTRRGKYLKIAPLAQERNVRNVVANG